ncbi:uncharacterized protein LOC134565187 isoform X2 [Prinia subflava]|uniref:uncharacterized protein LOC134565187 isoform X2 n=1 Tax=Prinia subflava TaxID=208062 RepID=UPI002FE2E4F9
MRTTHKCKHDWVSFLPTHHHHHKIRDLRGPCSASAEVLRYQGRYPLVAAQVRKVAHGRRDTAEGTRHRGHGRRDRTRATRRATRRCHGASGRGLPAPWAGVWVGPQGPWRRWWQRAGPGELRRKLRLSGLGMAPARLSLLPPLLLLGVAACAWRPARGREAPQTPDWPMTLKTIRSSVHKIVMYLNAALDLMGGEDRLCQYKCSDGSRPVPRYGYKPSPPNGCGSPLFGVQFDIGIPSMTRCCNHHDRCYDTWGNKKKDCDEQFQTCLSKICRNVQKTLGISENVQDTAIRTAERG